MGRELLKKYPFKEQFQGKYGCFVNLFCLSMGHG